MSTLKSHPSIYFSHYRLAAWKYGPLKKGCKVSMEDCRVLTHTMWHQRWRVRFVILTSVTHWHGSLLNVQESYNFFLTRLVNHLKTAFEIHTKNKSFSYIPFFIYCMFSYASSMAAPVDPLHLQNEKSPQLFDVCHEVLNKPSWCPEDEVNWLSSFKLQALYLSCAKLQ